MKIELEIPDALLPVVAEILANMAKPNYSEGDSVTCSPGWIMKKLGVSSETYSEAEAVVDRIQNQIGTAVQMG